MGNRNTFMTTFTKEVDVDVEVDIYFSDLTDIIDDLDASDRSKLINYMSLGSDSNEVNSMVYDMKMEICQLAMNKYSLSELEDKLGSKFELI